MSTTCHGVLKQAKNGSFIDSCNKICIPRNQIDNRSHGVFFGGNPFDSVFTVFYAQIILAFIVSRVVYLVLRPLRQPKFVCNILAGIILGPSVLGRNKTYLNTIFPKEEMLVFNTLSAFGASYYAFITAVKMNTTVILRTARNAWTIGVLNYLFPFIAIRIFSYLTDGKIVGLVLLKSDFLSSVFSSTYFPIVAHVMEELDLVTTELGRLATTSAMLIEIFSHSTMVITYIALSKSVIRSIFHLIAIVGPLFFVFYVVKPAIKQITKRAPEEKPVGEFYATAIMIGALIMTLVTDYAWGFFLPGAFLMGVIIPDGPPLGATLVEKYELMIMEVFLPFFFVQVGYLTDITSFEISQPLFFTLLFIVMCYLAKIVGTMVASVYLNIKLENAFLLGVILNFKGVFEFTIYQRMLSFKVVDEQCYTALVLFSWVFIAFFSPFIDIFYKPQVRLTNPTSKTNYLRTLQATSQDAELHVLTSIYHEDNVHGIINLLQASNSDEISPICAYVIHAIELCGGTTPSLNPYSLHGKKIKNNTSQQIIRAFSDYSRNSNGLVSIHPYVMVAPFKTMDNIICNIAEDRHVPLIIVPFYTFYGKEKDILLRDFNSRLQANAPCTVGILIEKGWHPRINILDHNHHCNVAVLFLGGADDREALALAIRMSRNPNVKINLLRVDLRKGDKCINYKIEEQLDELLIEKFVEKNIGNDSITCNEVVVNDSVEIVEVIKSLENSYDLVMVGKSPTKTQFEKEMMEWVENPELGVIGDLFASSDDSNSCRNMSVLVIQHCRVPSTSIDTLKKNARCNSELILDIV